MTWISDHNLSFQWIAIAYPRHNVNDGLIKPLLKLGYGCIIVSHSVMWMQLLIHALDTGGDNLN